MSDVEFDLDLINRVKNHLKWKCNSFKCDLQAAKALQGCDDASLNLKKGWFIAGGAIVSLLQGEEPNDYDMYFESNDWCTYYSDTVQNKKYDYLIANVGSYANMPVDGKLVTTNAITLNNNFQLITKLTGQPTDVTKSFDYEHCRAYYIPETHVLYMTKLTYNCIMQKRLVKHNVNPDASYSRESKFMNKGWKIA